MDLIYFNNNINKLFNISVFIYGVIHFKIYADFKINNLFKK